MICYNPFHTIRDNQVKRVIFVSTMKKLLKVKKVDIERLVYWTEQYKELSADRVLLGSNDIPSELRTYVASQIQLRAKLKSKLPTWYEHSAYIPKLVNLEQASSEEAGRYKACFVAKEDILLDLTGGMAVDFSCLAPLVKQAIYVEQDKELFQASTYNLDKLLEEDVAYKLYCYNSMEHIQNLVGRYKPSIIYLDPARREEQTNNARRTYAIEDCSPNLYELIDVLQELEEGYQPRVVVKLSPMLDVKYCLLNVPKLRSLHILAIHNEVKELILEIDLSLGEEHNNLFDTDITTTDLYRHRPKTKFTAKWQDEENSPLSIAESLEKYVYEPNGALMKSRLFKSLSKAFAMPLLHNSTHLYTSNNIYKDFMGRCFQVEEVLDFSSSIIRKLHKRIPRAEVICRNFPLKADILQKKLKIKAGGEQIILGTTLWDKRQVLLICYLCKYDG